jgi:hypothetical protein
MDDKPHNFQLTAVWYLNFLKGKCRLQDLQTFGEKKLPMAA